VGNLFLKTAVVPIETAQAVTGLRRFFAHQRETHVQVLIVQVVAIPPDDGLQRLDSPRSAQADVLSQAVVHDNVQVFGARALASQEGVNHRPGIAIRIDVKQVHWQVPPRAQLQRGNAVACVNSPRGALAR